MENTNSTTDISVSLRTKFNNLRSRARTCQNCPLNHHNQETLVFGTGNLKAKIVLVGEGPGYEESRQQIPFVGKSGQLLRNLLNELEIPLKRLYITNVVKHRPPANRDPTNIERQICSEQFLFNELEIIKPKYIIALGRIATQTLASSNKELVIPSSNLTGLVFDYIYQDHTVGKVFTLYHPAACLYRPNLLPRFIEDLKAVKSLLDN